MKRLFVVMMLAIMMLAAVSTQAEAAPPRGAVSFTFDDGLESFYVNAKVVLDQYGFKTTLFPVTSRIGWEGQIEGWQLQQLFKERHEIGCHTRDHVSLLGMNFEEARDEIWGARDDLKAFRIRMSGSLAPPFGEYNPVVISQLMASSVITSSREAWAEDTPFNTPCNFNAGAVRAVSVWYDTDIDWLRGILSDSSEDGSGIVLVFHDIIPSGATPRDVRDVSVDLLDQIVQHVRWLQAESGRRFQVLTVAQLVTKMKRDRRLCR